MLAVGAGWVTRTPDILLWSLLLGGTPHGHVAGSLAEKVLGTLLFNQLLQEPKAALPVAEFMLKTGLLSQFQVVDPVATGLTQEKSIDN
jgi:hypothetical protein